MKKKQQKHTTSTSSPSWVSRLLSLLFAQNELHVPSTKLKNYRNKITYNLPLQSECEDQSLSPLAELHLNEVCQAIDDWMKIHGNANGNCGDGDGNGDGNGGKKTSIFREVMAKSSRDGNMMIRVTVQKNKNESTNTNTNTNTNTSTNTSTSTNNPTDHNFNWDDMKEKFASHLVKLFPAITCICYNETNNHSRPTKDDPTYLIYGDNKYILEKTIGSELQYQISPDAFCEVNHEVENLQYEQTVNWIQKMFSNQRAILICSGRDINSYGLGFGSIRNVNSNNSSNSSNNSSNNDNNSDENNGKLFSEVIAVQHCPLVSKDAIANFKKHEKEIKSTVLHLTKDEMANGVSQALNKALQRQNHPPVVVITTGGRKGLNSNYIDFLKDHKSVQCIIYNSCSTKSLEIDMGSFISGSMGYYIDDFRSYDFFAGTKYSASVLRLLRRPRTLVLPIGPAGVGKSVLSKTIIDHSPSESCLWWHRDLEFANLRNKNVSMTKTKSMIHNQMLSFLKGDCNSVRIVDSTNGNAGARLLYIQEMRPELLIFVVLAPSTENDGNDIDNDNIVEILLNRTQNRLEGGNTSHPSFPFTVNEQRKKHEAILKGIEYPTIAELTDIDMNTNTNTNASTSTNIGTEKKCLRKILLCCNPLHEPSLSTLPFEIFLEYSISYALNQCLKDKKDTQSRTRRQIVID